MNFNHQQYISCLHAGQNVDIQRSNGRIQKAIITDVNHAAKTVTVEWQEKNEGKGKEVDLDTIIQFNPQLFTSINGANDNHFNGSQSNRRARLDQSQPVPYNHDVSPQRGGNDANKSKVTSRQMERMAANREQRRVKTW